MVKPRMETDEVPHRGVETSGPPSIPDPERLAVKTICASDILRKIVQSAERLRKVDYALSRYLNQARLLLVWKRGSGAMKMAGSAAKTVGTLMLVAAPLHPRIASGMRIAHKLWKLGTGLKILNAIANVFRDVWQKGCREVLLEFTHCAATLTRNLGVFGEVMRDLQSSTPALAQGAGQNSNSPAVVIQAIQEFVPPHQLPYATHVINMAFGNERYSPLFAFTALTLDSGNNSNLAQIMLEIEAFHFDEFVEMSESRALVAIGSFLHVSRELCDFLDGFQRLTERDCHFLQDCLHRLGQESGTIMKAVGVLVSLDKIRKQLNTEASNTSQASSQATSSLYDGRDIAHSSNLPTTQVISLRPAHRAGNKTAYSAETSVGQDNDSISRVTSLPASAVAVGQDNESMSTVISLPPSAVDNLSQEETPVLNLPGAHRVNVDAPQRSCDSELETDIHLSSSAMLSSLPKTDRQSSSTQMLSTVPKTDRESHSADMVSSIPKTDRQSSLAEMLACPKIPDPCECAGVEEKSLQSLQAVSETLGLEGTDGDKPQARGFVSSLYMPISSAVGKGSSMFIGKASSLLSSTFYRKRSRREQGESSQDDQGMEGEDRRCDPTRI